MSVSELAPELEASEQLTVPTSEHTSNPLLRVNQKGVKTPPWRKDPIILRRLEIVSKLYRRNLKLWQIAEQIGYSHASAFLDLERLRQLWAEHTTEVVEINRRRSVSNLRAAQAIVWDILEDPKADRRTKLVAAKEIREAEMSISILEGTAAPQKRELSGPNGAPIEISATARAEADKELQAWRVEQQQKLIESGPPED
jgi:hypothetical protein